MSMYPMQHAIYKGLSGKFGAAQFNLQLPHKYCPQCKKKDFQGNLTECSEHKGEKLVSREGTVFLEATSSKDKNVYDWEKKTVMALSVTDLSKLLHGLLTGCVGKDGAPGEVKIMHDPGAKTETMGKVQKYITLTSPRGPSEGFMLNVSEFGGQEKKIHTIPLTPDEAVVLRALFQAAIPRIMAWT